MAEDRPVDPAAVEKALAGDAAITHVAVIHCETTSGVLNPIAEVAAVVARAGRRLLIDSMSAFGPCPWMPARSPSTPSRPPPTNAWKACPAWAS